MKKILLPAMVFMMAGCDQDFEPDLSGWRTWSHPARRIHVLVDGKEKIIRLPGGEGIGYRYPQWTKYQDHILLTQLIDTDKCVNYQIVAADTTGAIIDTVYIAPPNVAVNFKLAPNDSLLLIKTYLDNCSDSTGDFRYTFYNRYSGGLPDTINVRRARGILLRETVWSPDSRKVILSEWSGQQVKGFVYDLVTKDTINIEKGSNFIWSPIDNDLVAYIKDYSVYTMNIATGEKEMVFEGKRKRSVAEFRWNPNGDFLMLHITSYLLNIESPMSEAHRITYFSMKDRQESREYFDGQRIDTWKDGGPAD